MAGQLPQKYHKGGLSQKADLRQYLQKLVTGAFATHEAALERIYEETTRHATEASERASEAVHASADAKVSLETVKALVEQVEALKKELDLLARKTGTQVRSAKKVLAEINRRV
jgi:vacuolar-type H+-ATPase subunit E/Vma4